MPRRTLSALELPYVVTGTSSCGSFTVRGPLDAARLGAAFAALRREYPVLTARIEANAFGIDLVSPDEPISESCAPVTVEHRPFVPGDVRLGLLPEREVAALQLVSDSDLHRVSLGVSHAVADGTHALFLNLRLWELYTDPAAEQAPAARLPAAPSELASRIQAAEKQPTAVSTRSVGVVPTSHAVDGGDFTFHRIVLDHAATDAVRRRAKDAGLSVHGLLAGIVVAAERARLGDSGVPDDEAVPMAVFSPVDLRSRSTPAVSPAEVTNFAGSSTAPLAVSAGATPEWIGRAVLDRLRDDLADGTVAAALTGTAPVTVTDGAPVRLSNLGTIPTPSTPADVTVLDFHTSSEVDIDRVRGLVHNAPPEALGPLIGLHYHALTFGGRLSIELRNAPGTLAPETVRRIRDDIAAALRTAVPA